MQAEEPVIGWQPVIRPAALEAPSHQHLYIEGPRPLTLSIQEYCAL